MDFEILIAILTPIVVGSVLLVAYLRGKN